MRVSCLLVALAGCSQSSVTSMNHPDLAMAASDPDLGEAPDLAGLTGGNSGLTKDRPYHFYVPSGYDQNQATPLLILLHGYSSWAEQQEAYWNMRPVAESKTFLLAYPDGTVDFLGNRFWNATNACCDFGATAVDDVAYVNAIIDDVSAKYNVDAKRIFVTGHSNGGFMSHRLACDAPRVAAIASLAGATWADPAMCQPASPIPVLQIHGDADDVIKYDGGSNFGAGMYPGARDTVATWAAKNGCTGQLGDTNMPLDLVSTIAGSETSVEKYTGCPAHGEVELWTIKGGGHVPIFQPTWGETLWGFLSSHPKP
jgi:polyhydroxybutyrate depolymerase